MSKQKRKYSETLSAGTVLKEEFFPETDERLAAIAAREEAATPGPWQVIVDEHPHHLGGTHIERRIFTTWEHGQSKDFVGVVNGSFGLGKKKNDGGRHMVHIDEANATFIAHAREDIPYLLAELRAAREEEARLRAVMELIAEDAREYERKVANFPLSIRVGLITGLTP